MEGKRVAVMLGDMVRKVGGSLIDMLPDYAAVYLIYCATFRSLPNLRHPKTFNEKVAWRKLYQHNPQFSIFSDKVAVKAQVAELVGEEHIIETLWEGSNPEDIPFESLTPPYVVKVNHSSGANVFIRAAQDVNRETIVASMREQLAFAHGHRLREWAYLGIPRKVLVERMILMPDGSIPDDYKFFTFHGRVHFVHCDRDRVSGLKQNLYDREWNLLSVWMGYAPISEPVSKPANLTQMIELAERIGAPFDFVRVDLYSPPQGIFFGETTFYPNGGRQPFAPMEWDNKFGELWKI